ncbi:hypothetical protein OEZ85_006816 [Tetradesmus obliquus]|uniref:Uncharacterized protein n=1 Tax=Tetradesmus obliquus TaxID=3088 RepID=A0ABY8TVR4_TETOB|nr:hypothetical protein OEZ85_006816 [Tetradesmus obliquus]
MPVSLQPGALKRLKTAIPAKPGLYEWGVRLPAGTTAAHLAAAAAAVAAGGGAAAVRGVAAPGSSSSNAASSGVRTRSGAGGLAQGQPRVEYGPVICFYLGKAGTLSSARRLRQLRSAMAGAAATAGTGTATAAAAATGPGETLRTRFNKYALTKAGRLGPVREPHKDALFAQLQAAGGQLCFRWCVAVAAEPCDMERQLLERLDYAANVVLNGQRREVLLA